MAVLIDLISPHLALTDAEIVALLNSKSVEVVDSQRWTWAGLADRFGTIPIGQVDELLKTIPGMGWVRIQLGGSGIDFSLQQTQDALENLRVSIPDLVDSLKAVGKSMVSPWVNAGNPGEVTEIQVSTARERIAVRQWVSRAMNEVLAPMANNSTISQIKSAIQGLE